MKALTERSPHRESWTKANAHPCFQERKLFSFLETTTTLNHFFTESSHIVSPLQTSRYYFRGFGKKETRCSERPVIIVELGRQFSKYGFLDVNTRLLIFRFCWKFCTASGTNWPFESWNSSGTVYLKKKLLSLWTENGGGVIRLVEPTPQLLWDEVGSTPWMGHQSSFFYFRWKLFPIS